MCHYQGVKMKLTPWLLLICMCLVSCSGSKSAEKVNEETPLVELSDADEFIETPTEDQSVKEDVIVESTEANADEAMATEEPIVAEQEPVVDEPKQFEPEIKQIGSSEKQYTVQKNETLMLIAFKLYGNYERWKELASHNRGLLNGSTNIAHGMVLKYFAPAEEFVWNPEGLPYLIKTGDTLGGISKQVYTTERKWKLIWENNRPLIKDPNKIYAGFTIHYLENGREVANQF